PAERHVLPAAVFPALGLADHVAEPAHHHVEEQHEAGGDADPARRLAVEDEHRAERHQEERGRSHDRPGHRLRHRVVRLLAVGGCAGRCAMGHFAFLPQLVTIRTTVTRVNMNSMTKTTARMIRCTGFTCARSCAALRRMPSAPQSTIFTVSSIRSYRPGPRPRRTYTTPRWCSRPSAASDRPRTPPACAASRRARASGA